MVDNSCYSALKIRIGNVCKNGFNYAICRKQLSNVGNRIGVFKEILDKVNGRLVDEEDIIICIAERCITSHSNNKQELKEFLFSKYANENCLWLVIHPLSEFLCGQKSSRSEELPFAQDLLCGEKQLPILHLATTDVFINNLYGVEHLHPLVPRLYQIMDSSIWNYLVPLLDVHYPDYVKGDILEERIIPPKGTQKWSNLFRKAIECIYNNYERGLYNLEVSQEYADLNARLASESFLSGAHALGVSPFIFHSESAIERLIIKELNQKDEKKIGVSSTLDRIATQKWRILLIDDKAKSELRKNGSNDYINSDDSNLPWNCKLTIIKDILNNHFNDYDNFIIEHRAFNDKTISSKFREDKENEKNGLLIEYVETYNMAKKALKTNKYDIILLDYLLDSDISGVHYGYEVLDAIFDNVEKAKDEEGRINFEKVDYQIGPHRRLFFIFISAYSTAVYERLLSEGLNRSEKYWHIAVGACPTNTPKLFLYNLLKLMEKQLEDSGVDKLSAQSIYNIVNKIYGDTYGEDKGKTVRYRANKYYQEVLNMHYYYRKMLNDVHFPSDGVIFNSEGSVLITNFIKKNVNLGGFLEHLTQLVHLTAFGTVRQWPEMWEEYIFFKAQFNIEQFKKTENGETRFRNLCMAIEDHILNLKSDVG
jgi:hypothetical protein